MQFSFKISTFKNSTYCHIGNINISNNIDLAIYSTAADSIRRSPQVSMYCSSLTQSSTECLSNRSWMVMSLKSKMSNKMPIIRSANTAFTS